MTGLYDFKCTTDQISMEQMFLLLFKQIQSLWRLEKTLKLQNSLKQTPDKDITTRKTQIKIMGQSH